MRKEGVLGLVLIVGVLILIQNLNARCPPLDFCSTGACPQDNICPFSSNLNVIEWFYKYNEVGTTCTSEGQTYCTSQNECQTDSCLSVRFIDSDRNGVCEDAYCVPDDTTPGDEPVICAYTTHSSKVPLTLRWWNTGTPLRQETSGWGNSCSDGHDNDCDGKCDIGGCPGIPQGDPSCCIDLDGDGYNKTAGGVCGTVIDCNDNDFSVKPSGPEICDNKDNQCSGTGYGTVDEGCDDDTDDYCDATMTYVTSTTCPNGPGDCDDNNVNINPGKTEVCSDGIDNDCRNGIDDGCGGPGCVYQNVESILNNNCDDGIDNDCTIEKDWDMQNWVNGQPMGTLKSSKGDDGCLVGFEDAFLAGECNVQQSAPYYEGTNITLNCFYNAPSGINSIDAYVLEGSVKRYCRLIFSATASNGFNVYTCGVGVAGTKDITATINQSRSYNLTGDIVLPITVEALPFDDNLCDSIQKCSDYTPYGADACNNDSKSGYCNVADDDSYWPDGVSCNTCNLATGNKTACACAWNGTACNLGFQNTSCSSTGIDLSTGWCSVQNEEIVKECNIEPNFGYRNYTWAGAWINGGATPAPASCTGGFTKLVLCPEIFRLPFFGIYAFVASLIAIGGVYFFLIKKKKIVFV